MQQSVSADERKFHEAYERLSEDGRCDSPDGAEYERVLAEWREAGCPDTIDEFIGARANEVNADRDEVSERLKERLGPDGGLIITALDASRRAGLLLSAIQEAGASPVLVSAAERLCSTTQKLKEELLSDQNDPEPECPGTQKHQFYTFYCEAEMSGAVVGVSPDEDRDWLVRGERTEPMAGPSVQILVRPDTSAEVAARLLRKAGEWIGDSADLLDPAAGQEEAPPI